MTHRRVCRLPHGLSCASSGRAPRWSGLRGGQVLGRKPRGRAPAPARRPPGRGRRVTCRRLATGSPRRRGTPCCSTTAASTRSTTSSPWRSWTSRCSSPSRQVGPLAGRAAPRQALGRLKAPRPHAAPSGVLTARPHVPVREPGLWADPGRAKVRVACGNPAGRLRGRGRGLAAARCTGGLGAHGPAVGEGRAPTRRGARGPRPLTSAFSPHLPPHRRDHDRGGPAGPRGRERRALALGEGAVLQQGRRVRAPRALGRARRVPGAPPS